MMYPSWGCMRVHTPIENLHCIMSHRAECKTVHTSSYQVWKHAFWYIPVYTGIYQYILVHTITTIFIQVVRIPDEVTQAVWTVLHHHTHLESACTPGQDRAKSYVPVRTSHFMYWYMRLGLQEFISSTYWYVLVCTKNKTWWFLIHPGSTSRANSSSIQLHCKRYAMMISSRWVSTERLAWSSRPVFFFRAVSSTERPPRRGLPQANNQSQVLTSYTLLPRLPSASAVSALPMGKPDPLSLLNLCGIVGEELPARNRGMRGTLPSTLATGATYRHGMGEGQWCQRPAVNDAKTVRCY